MVMVTAQRLVELEAIVAGARHALQHADSLEHDEVAIERALRQLGSLGAAQISDRHRPSRSRDQLENLPALPGMTLPDASESAFGRGMQLLGVDGHAVTVPLARAGSSWNGDDSGAQR
jgi:hypothetical protein